MSFNIYNVAIPTFIRGLENLSAVLTKGEQHNPGLTTARLAEDMYPLTKQVQIASDAAKFFAARACGQQAPTFEDTEETFADLQTRITKTITYLKSINPADMEGADTKRIQFTNKAGTFDFTGSEYLLKMSFPNFFFHTTTAYDILRHNGVQLGKRDFLGS